MKGLKENLREWAIDKSWTLFLDRDGVINRKIEGDYVRDLAQFEWLAGVKDAIVKLSAVFGRIIIVSNQQGVGKKLMTKEAVETIHEHIRNSFEELGIRIDRIYYAPHLKEENSEFRKPNIGMALQAKNDFPEIDFSKSVMVGDSMSDMEFGKTAGMKTIFILNGKTAFDDVRIDATIEDLQNLVRLIKVTSKDN